MWEYMRKEIREVNMLLNYIIYGQCNSALGKELPVRKVTVIENMLDSVKAQSRKCELDVLKLLS